MKTTRKRKCAPRKKKCTCTCCKVVKRKRTTAPKKVAKRKPAKRATTKRKTAKKKALKRSGRGGKRLSGLNGTTFRLTALQKRKLSPALQRAILERQRRLGKTIIS